MFGEVVEGAGGLGFLDGGVEVGIADEGVGLGDLDAGLGDLVVGGGFLAFIALDARPAAAGVVEDDAAEIEGLLGIAERRRGRRPWRGRG